MISRWREGGEKKIGKKLMKSHDGNDHPLIGSESCISNKSMESSLSLFGTRPKNFSPLSVGEKYIGIRILVRRGRSTRDPIYRPPSRPAAEFPTIKTSLHSSLLLFVARRDSRIGDFFWKRQIMRSWRGKNWLARAEWKRIERVGDWNLDRKRDGIERLIECMSGYFLLISKDS